MSWALPMGLRWCFSSSAVKSDLKMWHSLVLHCFHLCLMQACAILKHVREAEIIPAVLQKGQKKSESSANAGFLETKCG